MSMNERNNNDSVKFRVIKNNKKESTIKSNKQSEKKERMKNTNGKL